MRYVNYLLLGLFLYTHSFAQTGTIANLVVKQRANDSKTVDIYYDITGNKFSYCISVEASLDNDKAYSPLTKLTGDYGFNITKGNKKHIMWSLDNNYLNLFNDSTKVKITATYPAFEFVTVDAGEYTWGLNDERYTIDYDFQIMKYEVTNNEYVNYLRAAYSEGLIQANRSSVGGNYKGDIRIEAGIYEYIYLDAEDCKIRFSRGNFYIEKNYENHPVVEVSWFGANAFAEYYGCGLPLEEEWEMAARGNTGNEFPWGQKASNKHANFFESGDPFDNGTTPVGFYNGQRIQDY